MDELNNMPQPESNMTDWYRNFTNPTDTAAQQANTTNSSALADLLMYSIKLKAYADFVSQLASSVEGDIKQDIYADMAPATPVINGQTSANPAAPVTNPLAFAIANRENLVNVATNIVELSKAVDSILARVKTKA